MKITNVITTDVDLAEIYTLCKPIDRKKCAKAIREHVAFQIRKLATDPNGGWMYPDNELIANQLIDQGLAETL